MRRAGATRAALARFGLAVGGASAVEFAILACPLLLFVAGTMEFGRLMWTREALQHTAIAGARCMGMTQTSCGTAGVYDAGMTTRFVIAQAASWSIPLTAANVSLNNAATCGGVGGFSQVSLTYTFNSIVPALTGLLSGGTNLSATACFPNHT